MMMNKKITHIALIKADNKIYIMASKESGHPITGFSSETEGVRYFEKSYNDYHRRGYTNSMSACINYITFQPSIIPFIDLEKLKDVVVDPPVAVQLGNVSGYMIGIPLREGMEKLWEKGVKPQLIW